MIKKIFKFIGLTLLTLIISFLIWFKFIYTEYDEFKNATFLEHRKHISTDGPYIIQGDDSIHKIKVVEQKDNFKIISSKILNENFNKKITVSTYNYDKPSQYSFDVVLKDTINIPESEYITDGDIFAVSDIEGNFYAFQKLLKSAEIVDENFNWIFKDNHLVLTGDFVDRGLNVTQCLWLIYKLESQAEKQGGSVHFINGNHEIMNLSGKIYHVRSKYKFLASELGLNYSTDLFGKKSELGKWLRTKNAIEKINGNLFTHAGISPELISFDISLDSINKKARQFYGENDTEIEKDELASFLYSSGGPFWYRNNTRDVSGNIQNEMNEIISHFNVKRLIIGHSTKSDIKSYHRNTLYNIDIHFPNTDNNIERGKGLLIQGDSLYKIDDNGIKIKLE